MTEPVVYMVVNLIINDPIEYRKYEKGFFPLLKKYGGEFITYDDNQETFEGTDPVAGRSIIFQFPNEQAARDWYDDDDYQELSKFRRAGTTLKHLTMVRGIPPRQ